MNNMLTPSIGGMDRPTSPAPLTPHENTISNMHRILDIINSLNDRMRTTLEPVSMCEAPAQPETSAKKALPEMPPNAYQYQCLLLGIEDALERSHNILSRVYL